ncbi:hypothetical protein ACFFK0_06890 [Paenibacillus chartarius]|uniref:Uncharacterized protein n=1 Tax=Paenibacillus chartarius TaxID=747481 RepID=A0ABV6DHR2_9BACL
MAEIQLFVDLCRTASVIDRASSVTIRDLLLVPNCSSGAGIAIFKLTLYRMAGLSGTSTPTSTTKFLYPRL